MIIPIKDGFTISTNKNDLDINVIYNFLHNEAYWSKGIPMTILEDSIQNSICFGVFNGNPQEGNAKQVGFARLITDLATFAYLADVFILPSYRGIGLSKCLVEQIVNYSGIKNVRKIVLATLDAHDLYSKYGFTPVDPERYMEISHPNIYMQK
ncbi:GNAT family N-acetyltransferase [Terrilactibacillus laevilacticus]|uniref:GNAT family N-acetyltransferase n=1 Tax=Terrilactibacillus laevilacticus TaxID=1380157 RepID=A0ABW5PMU6_9BACI|nr:GNAT family N-acetyltransferase [Terrilactibacillus laevilacticus]